LIGKKLIIEVGKVKAGADVQEESIDKDYTNDAQAKSSMVSKIKEKLVKGYYSAIPVREIKPASTLKRRARSPSKATSG
jgi:predicted DNA-binding WGR domain protein